MKFKVTILGRLSGSNEIKEADRSHWSKGAKLRKEELLRCKTAIWIQNLTSKAHFTHPAFVSFAWIEPNAKRDLDNITGAQKVILDALVAMRVLSNDTRAQVKGLFHYFLDPNPKDPRIEVEVEDRV